MVNMQRLTSATYSLLIGFILIFQNLYGSCLFSVLTASTHGFHGHLGAVLLVYRSVLVLNVANQVSLVGAQRLAQALTTHFESITTLSETLLIHELGDLAFGINNFTWRQV